MDTGYVPNTPEWRPRSSLSETTEATSVRSSRLLIPVRRAASPATSDRSGSITFHNDSLQQRLEIAPWESSVCEELIEAIRELHGSRLGTDTPHDAALVFHSVEEALRFAALTIQYNAKWFAEPALTTLIEVAISTVAKSTASAELFAAVSLIDTVTVYSLLPPPALEAVAKFLSQTYYAATRAHKTNKLAEATWLAFQHIRDSHLGQQIVTLLLDIVSCSDGTHLETRSGYAQFTGALTIVADKLLLHNAPQSTTPSTNLTELVDALWPAVVSGTDSVRAVIMEMLNALLANDFVVEDLDRQSSWDALLDTVGPCVTLTPEASAAKSLIETLIARTAHFEARNLPVLADLAIDLKLPLTKELSEGMLAIWEEVLPTREIPNAFFLLLTKLCRSSEYTSQLMTLVDRSILEIFLKLPGQKPFATFVQTVQDLSTDPSTTEDAAEILSAALVMMFRRSVRFAGREREQRTIFHALCQTSRRCVSAAEALFRIRADVDGYIYVESGLLSQTFPAYSDSSSMHAVMHDGSTLPLQDWHDIIFAILEDTVDWKVYDYFLSELPSLLGNHALFDERTAFVKRVAIKLLELLETGAYPEPPPDTGLTKSYVTVALLRVIVVVLSYHRHLSRHENVGIISTLLSTAGSRDYTVSIACIHALTICCYELPDLLTSYMNEIIEKMSKLVTQRFLAIHVLLFLAGLSRQPQLFHNFQTHDYKRIFGVCGSYLQSIRGTDALTERQSGQASEQSSGVSTSSTTDALPHYVYALAHHVIAFWYLVLRSQDRDTLKEYITSCLRYTTADGVENVEDQGLVTIDLMDRIDATGYDTGLDLRFEEIDGRTLVLHRLSGLLLLTTETALRTGKTALTVRRATGTDNGLITTSPCVSEDSHDVSVTVEGCMDDFISIFPDDPSGQTYGKIYVPRSSSLLGSETTLTLPKDDNFSRAIQQFDRTSPRDSHKAGLIYLGEGQTSEDEILQNRMGSPDYVEFFTNLGNLVRLKGANFNTQGLDHIDDTDGQHTIVWQNNLTELVFHITTLMPNNDDVRLNTANKKKHIGNDYVNIVFNNSGSPFDFNTFPSQFNFVYIVITPSARTSFIQTRTQKATKDKKDRYYAVQVLTRPGYPAISSAAEEKIVSAASLPEYVRNLALNECVLSVMWAYRDELQEYPSSWRSRLHQIRRLRERYG